MSDLDSTQRFYTRWAQLYDHVATAPGVTSWRERVVEMLSLSPGDTVVEMGCGTGANFPHLRSAVGPEGEVIGIDLVEAMLAGARNRIDRRGWQNVHVTRGDATQPPIEQADAVVSTFLIGMLRDPQAAIEQWIDHLRPGGRLGIMNAGRSNNTFAMPLNLLFRLFVRFSNPGGPLLRTSPTTQLEDRWQTARDTLEAETVGFRTSRMGLGLVRSARGQRPE